MSDIVDIPFNRLEQDENGVRKIYFGLKSMAESIALAGLLENLCVVLKEGCTDDDPRFVVKAGNRRYRGMKLLVDSGRMPEDFPVPCKILSTDGVIESGIENIAREDLRPWEIGNHYLALSERGLHQKEIASSHGKSQPHVSQHIRIARDLSPKVIERLSRLSIVDCPGILHLCRIAEHIDSDTLGPDTEKQFAALDVLLEERKNGKVRKSAAISGARRRLIHMASRVELLTKSDIPPHAAPYVSAILRFLREEQTELTFPAAPSRGGSRRLRRPGGPADGDRRRTKPRPKKRRPQARPG